MLTFPTIDPILVTIGPFEIRWYALAYVMGLLVGSMLVERLNRKPPVVLPAKALENVLLYAMVGIVVGGRLGYVLFYHFEYYLHHPLEVFQTWHGGMSSHGGTIGLALAFYYMSRHYRISFLATADLITVAVPFGIMLGRLGNFINGELYGRVTTVPWGMVFPEGGPLPRHPSQLYEAITEGLLLWILVSILAWRTSIRHYPGMLMGVALATYGVIRVIVENYREPDAHIGLIGAYLSMGQLLSLPFILCGALLIYYARKQPAWR